MSGILRQQPANTMADQGSSTFGKQHQRRELKPPNGGSTMQALVKVMTSSGSISSFMKSNTKGAIRLNRPNSKVKKAFQANSCYRGIPNSEGDAFQSTLQPLVIESFENDANFFLHSTGARSTGKTTAIFGDDENNPGFLQLTAQQIFSCISIASAESTDIYTTTLSYLTTPSVSNSENNNSELDDQLISIVDLTRDCPRPIRVRERGGGSKEFYAENLTEVVCNSFNEFRDVLNYGLGADKSCDKYHSLCTIRVYKNEGESVCNFGFLDLCGKERKLEEKGEDVTLKAYNRVVDALYNKFSHVPFRDSKVTRLASYGFANALHSVAITCVDNGEGKFDETCAVLEHMTKLQKIKVSAKKGPRFDRRAELAKASQKVKQLHAILVQTTPGIQSLEGLKSHHIELDMTSSDEMVDFRDALAKKELLEVNHFEKMVQVSSDWWKAMNE